MKNESCAWVLRNLCKKGSLFNSKLLIPDTLLLSKGSVDYTWLYTSNSGTVKEKSEEECVIPVILDTFFKEKSVILVERSGFSTLDIQSAVNKIIKLQLDHDSVLMSLHSTKRLYASYKDNSPRLFFQDYKDTKTTLKSSFLKEDLTKLSKVIVKTIERNAGVKIVSIDLVFVLNKHKNLCFIGSEKCEVSPKIRKAASCILKNFNCKGDFCKIRLKSEAKMSTTAADYDDLLEQVRSRYFTSGEKNIENFKRELRIETLQNQKSSRDRKNLVAFSVVLIGKQFLERSGLSHRAIMEIKEKDFIDSFMSLNKEDDFFAISPCQEYRLYENVFVCDACYEIYQVILQLKNKYMKKRRLHSRITRNSDKVIKKIDYEMWIPKVIENISNKLKKGTVFFKNKNEIEDNQFRELKQRVFPDHMEYMFNKKKASKSWRQYITNLKRNRYNNKL